MCPIVFRCRAREIEAFLDRGEEDAILLQQIGQLIEAGFRQVAKRFVILGNQPLVGLDVSILPLEQYGPTAEGLDEMAAVRVLIRGSRGLRRRL